MDRCESKSVVSFGPFAVNLRTQEIRRHGTVVRLLGQPFLILEMLLAHPGELVTRDELQQRLWPDTSLVDCTHGLNAAINKLREALGDSAITPQYVETLPRRGYRFIGKVHEQSSEEAASIVPVSAPIVSDRILASYHQQESFLPSYVPPRRWPIALVACAALLAGIFGGIGLNSRFQKTSSPQAVAAPAGPVEVAQAESKERTNQGAAVSKSPTAPSIPVGGVSARPVVLRTSSSGVSRKVPTLRTVVSGNGSALRNFLPTESTSPSCRTGAAHGKFGSARSTVRIPCRSALPTAQALLAGRRMASKSSSTRPVTREPVSSLPPLTVPNPRASSTKDAYPAFHGMANGSTLRRTVTMTGRSGKFTNVVEALCRSREMAASRLLNRPTVFSTT